MRIHETKYRAEQEYLEAFSKYGILVQFEARSRERLAFFQTRSHAVVLYNTPLAACIEKAVCMNTQDELYHKVRLTPRVPRVVFKSNSQYGQQDPRSQEARSSWDPSSDSKSYGETCSNILDHRISGVPLSAVEQQNTTRQNKVKKLIEKFDHQYKESFFQDLKNQTQKINKFRKESQVLLADMNNTEIFEFCETSSKQQCFECNTYWEIGIIYCSCGRNLKSSQRPQSSSRTTTTSPQPLAMLSRKTAVVGAKHGPSGRQSCTAKRNRCSKRHVRKKHGNHPTILSRWYASESFRDSLSNIGWAFRPNCLGEACLRRHKSRENSKLEALDSHVKCRRTSATTQSTTRPCSSKERMQTIARRAPRKTQQDCRTIPRSQEVRQRKEQ